MKFGAAKTAGGAAISVPKLLLGLLAVVACGMSSAQSLYKYRGENGEWIYTDRKPDDNQAVEVRALESSFFQPKFSVAHEVDGRSIEIVAHNEFFGPMEVQLRFEEVTGVEIPPPENQLRWLVAPRSGLKLISLQALEGVERPYVRYSFKYVPGDPNAVHHAAGGYRAPFSLGKKFPITQAHPDSVTHNSRASTYAVDVAMPIGTDIVAARGGVVLGVASDNWRSGTDLQRDGAAANLVRILHDDGTMSLYAHLNLNSVRVKPGDRVSAGQYIADSGNTGFSTGPHLHFAVQKNVGMSIESVPIVFRSSGSSDVVPNTGSLLSAYP